MILPHHVYLRFQRALNGLFLAPQFRRPPDMGLHQGIGTHRGRVADVLTRKQLTQVRSSNTAQAADCNKTYWIDSVKTTSI